MKNRYPAFIIISFFVFILDQATKFLIIRNLSFLQVIKIVPFFNIVYYRNIGSAFGMFKDLGNIFFIIISCAAIAVILAVLYREKETNFGYPLIIGGAAGNLMDRLIHGYVIDFLEFYAGSHYWPAFNIADASLTLGIILLLIHSFTRRKGV